MNYDPKFQQAENAHGSYSKNSKRSPFFKQNVNQMMGT